MGAVIRIMCAVGAVGAIVAHPNNFQLDTFISPLYMQALYLKFRWAQKIISRKSWNSISESTLIFVLAKGEATRQLYNMLSQQPLTTTLVCVSLPHVLLFKAHLLPFHQQHVDTGYYLKNIYDRLWMIMTRYLNFDTVHCMYRGFVFKRLYLGLTLLR